MLTVQLRRSLFRRLFGNSIADFSCASVCLALLFNIFNPVYVQGQDLATVEWHGDDQYWQGPIIDAHSQVDPKTDLAGIVPLLDRAGVEQSLLSTRFDQSSDDILSLAKKHPARIIPMAKTKTKAFMKGKKGFPKDFNAEIKKFDFKGMAEIIMWHAAKKGVGAGKAVVGPDSPRIKPFIQTARQKGWPFIAHFEFAGMEFESERIEYMETFKVFLSENKDVPVGLIHMGQLNAEKAEKLLKAYSNLFFITSQCNPITQASSTLPWTRLFENEEFKPEWRQLIIEYPDRFVLAFDNVFSFHWEGKFYPQILFWRKALNRIPDDIAQAIAHKNARRLWKLEPAYRSQK